MCQQHHPVPATTHVKWGATCPPQCSTTDGHLATSRNAPALGVAVVLRSLVSRLPRSAKPLRGSADVAGAFDEQPAAVPLSAIEVLDRLQYSDNKRISAANLVL